VSGVPEKNFDDVEALDSRSSPVLQRQLSNLGFLSSSPDCSDTDTRFDVAAERESSDDETQLRQPAAVTMCDLSEFCEGLESQFTARLTSFVKLVLESRLLKAINRLYDKHQQCLNVMIDSTFVAANDVACTPARLKYARDQEVRYCDNTQFIICLFGILYLHFVHISTKLPTIISINPIYTYSHYAYLYINFRAV